MANKKNVMTVTPARPDQPDFPCVMQDSSGNTYTCSDPGQWDSFVRGGMTLVTAKKKATKKTPAKK